MSGFAITENRRGGIRPRRRGLPPSCIRSTVARAHRRRHRQELAAPGNGLVEQQDGDRRGVSITDYCAAQRIPEFPGFHPRFPRSGDCCDVDALHDRGFPDGRALDQASRHRQADRLAPGSAILLHRRVADVLNLASHRSGAARCRSPVPARLASLGPLVPSAAHQWAGAPIHSGPTRSLGRQFPILMPSSTNTKCCSGGSSPATASYFMPSPSTARREIPNRGSIDGY